MNDEGIVSLYWARDEAAIIETSNKYGNYCYTISYNILFNREDSEECVNDTYTKAWNSIPPNRPNVLAAFLGKIVRNISINRYRENTAQKRGGHQMNVILDELGDIASDRPDPEDKIIGKDLAGAINEFLAGIPKDKRVMFVRRYWYAEDIRTIASRMNVSENSVAVSIHRVRTKLRDYLGERGFDL